MLKEKGMPIDADIAAEYFRDIAEVLRAIGNPQDWDRRTREGFARPDGSPSFFMEDEALNLAADVLEWVANSKGGRVDLGHLIRGGIKSETLPQLEAVRAVQVVCFESDTRTLTDLILLKISGKPLNARTITRKEAYKRAGDRLRRDPDDIARKFRAYEKRHQTKLNWFAEGKRGPRVKG